MDVMCQEKEEEPVSQKRAQTTKVIGLTGGIGSGKTTVANYIQDEGFSVYNSDQRAKDLVNEDFRLKESIIQLLGKEAYTPQGLYNRKFVSDLVFKDNDLLLHLNHIIHPAVNIDFQHWLKQNEDHAMVFKETALLFELKLHEQCYKSILVTASQKLRIKRVMDRDGKTYREVEQIIDKQMPEFEKEKLADYILENCSDLKELKAKTKNVIQDLLQELNVGESVL